MRGIAWINMTLCDSRTKKVQKLMHPHFGAGNLFEKRNENDRSSQSFLSALVLERMEDVYYLIARLLYGANMRLAEYAQLWSKGIDFQRREITIRAGKDGRDCMRMLLLSLVPQHAQIEAAEGHAYRMHKNAKPRKPACSLDCSGSSHQAMNLPIPAQESCAGILFIPRPFNEQSSALNAYENRCMRSSSCLVSCPGKILDRPTISINLNYSVSAT